MNEWEARNLRIAHNVVALNLAVGAQSKESFCGDRMKVTADPVNPDDDNPDEERHYYVELDELAYDGTGIKRTKYELTLTKVVNDAD